MEGIFVFVKPRAWLKAGLGYVAESDRVFAGVRSALVLVCLFDEFEGGDDPIRVGVFGVKNEEEILARVADVHGGEKSAVLAGRIDWSGP